MKRANAGGRSADVAAGGNERRRLRVADLRRVCSVAPFKSER